MKRKQYSLVVLKPDALERRLETIILERLSLDGFVIEQFRRVGASEELIAEHYRHLPKEVLKNIHRWMSGSILIAMIVSGDRSKLRQMVGATDPGVANPGTIRGDLCYDTLEMAIDEDRALWNLIHASDSAESAERELKLWFPEFNLMDEYRKEYERINQTV